MQGNWSIFYQSDPSFSHPGDGDRALVFTDSGEMIIATWSMSSMDWHDDNPHRDLRVMYWMSLPPRP